jgi:hypothetical protein
MMAIVAFGPSKSMVVTFSPCSSAWRLNTPRVDFGQFSNSPDFATPKQFSGFATRGVNSYRTVPRYD